MEKTNWVVICKEYDSTYDICGPYTEREAERTANWLADNASDTSHHYTVAELNNLVAPP